MAYFVYTRKNFPDAQKLSGLQCRHADEVFGTLMLPQYCSQPNPANIAISTGYLRISIFRVQVYCLNINALTQWTGHLHL